MPEIQWKADVNIGNIVTLLVVICGLAMGWGTFSSRLTALESQSAKNITTGEQLNTTLHSLENAIVRINAQMDEREKRFDLAQAAAAYKEDQKDLRRRP